jgi:hypothetical protein
MTAAQTNAKLMAIIAQLQAQVAALQNAAPAAAAAHQQALLQFSSQTRPRHWVPMT